MTEENIEIIESEPVEFANTTCEHFFVLDSFQSDDMLSVVCTNCPHGCMVDPNLYALKAGKLVRIKE